MACGVCFVWRIFLDKFPLARQRRHCQYILVSFERLHSPQHVHRVEFFVVMLRS